MEEICHGRNQSTEHHLAEAKQDLIGNVKPERNKNNSKNYRNISHSLSIYEDANNYLM